MKVYIDLNGSLFDGNTCDVSSMVLCQLDSNNNPFKNYNLDGTPNVAENKKTELNDNLQQSNFEAKQYLSDTDWMLMRELDGGKKMTKAIKEKRAKARKAIK